MSQSRGSISVAEAVNGMDRINGGPIRSYHPGRHHPSSLPVPPRSWREAEGRDPCAGSTARQLRGHEAHGDRDQQMPSSRMPHAPKYGPRWPWLRALRLSPDPRRAYSCAWALLPLLLLGCSTAASPTCTPPCSPGYVCVSGECVEACNPLCGEGQHCGPDATCIDDPLDTSTDTIEDTDAGDTATEIPEDPDVEDVTVEDVLEECPYGRIRCGGECIDPMTSEEFCGDCDTSCPLEALCVWGECECQRAGETYCDGACIPSDEDRLNCGGCGVECTDEQICTGGSCEACSEPEWFSVCGNKCRLLSFDHWNCGTCGHECTGDTPFCFIEECVACSGPFMAWCEFPDGSTRCTMTNWDHFNCGYCGHVCPDATPWCDEGTCRGS